MILFEIQHRVPKDKNLSKLYEVRKEPDKNPSAFYERLCKVAKKWMDFNLEKEVNRNTFNMLFMGQSSQNIRKEAAKGGQGRMNAYFTIN